MHSPETVTSLSSFKLLSMHQNVPEMAVETTLPTLLCAYSLQKAADIINQSFCLQFLFKMYKNNFLLSLSILLKCDFFSALCDITYFAKVLLSDIHAVSLIQHCLI